MFNSLRLPVVWCRTCCCCCFRCERNHRRMLGMPYRLVHTTVHDDFIYIVAALKRQNNLSDFLLVLFEVCTLVFLHWCLFIMQEKKCALDVWKTVFFQWQNSKIENTLCSVVSNQNQCCCDNRWRAPSLIDINNWQWNIRF